MRSYDRVVSLISTVFTNKTDMLSGLSLSHAYNISFMLSIYTFKCL